MLQTLRVLPTSRNYVKDGSFKTKCVKPNAEMRLPYPSKYANGSACVLNILNAWLPPIFSKGGTSVSLSVHMTPGHSTAPERITFRRSELPQWFLKASHSPQSESQNKGMSLGHFIDWFYMYVCMCVCAFVCVCVCVLYFLYAWEHTWEVLK